MMISSKTVEGDVNMLTHVGITDMVYEIHRRSHHYSLKKKAPKQYEELLQQVQVFPLDIVKEAYDIYSTSKQDDSKLPHPNYFLAVCKRLNKEKKKAGPTSNSSWGKII